MATRSTGAVIGSTALLLVVLLAAAGAAAGFSEEGVRIVVRWTAKIAVVLFVLAFSASSLQRLVGGGLPAWLLANRRPLGLGFALAHTLHLAALVVLGWAFPDPFVAELNIATLVGGGLAYAFLFAMAATSSDAAVRRLGRARWSRLHTVGGWYIWLIFAQSYVPRAFVDPLYVPFALLVLAALPLRILRWRRVRAGAHA